MDIVVVESPAKAKTINKYLGSSYKVLASYGHVRDLPSKDGSVRPDDGFSMDWEVDGRSKKHIDAIAKAVKAAEHLYLATDPDREGEAISWHVREILEQKKALKNVGVKRVVFNEITKSAIQEAFQKPRELDEELVAAYLARRALDYLVGFTLSPVLWRKLPGSRSAGRVQSVALRLVCEREAEIENFNPREYWTVTADLANSADAKVSARLTHLNGKKLDKMDLGTEAAATAATEAIKKRVFSVAAIERKKVKRNPAPPFTTSTLQQEASRKLGFGAKRTMSVAQKLYEGVPIGGETVGLITYMRTDGVQMSNEAIAACREYIGHAYGGDYVPKSPHTYKTKAKNAQEAHEAIRPTGVSRRPKDVSQYLTAEQLKLYTLVWKRTVASQMQAAVLDQVAADIVSGDKSVTLRANGSVVAFDGFFKVYQEGRDDAEDKNAERMLAPLKEGEPMEQRCVTPEQHFTQPPPRFTEASLVKRLEELGIGRPSTYAPTLSVLQDRDYVRLDKRRFIPEDRGRMVTAFLTSFFQRYVAYDFTADMEEKLDDISGGRLDWRAVLHEFWGAFHQTVEGTKDLHTREVLDTLDELLGPHFFRDGGDNGNPRACPACKEGRLGLKLSKYGAFIGCSNYPQCRHTQPLAVTDGGASPEAGLENGARHLGDDPQTDLAVSLRKGPYGHYVQLGEPQGEGKTAVKPKRTSLPRGLEPADVDLEKALSLLSLPRDIGLHPEDGQMITAGIGRFGSFVKHGATYVSLGKDDGVLTVGMNRAVDLIASKPKKDPPKDLGKHPKDGKQVTLCSGRFGPYVRHGRTMASLPKGTSEDTVDLDAAIKLIAAKSAKGGKKTGLAKKKKKTSS